MRNLWFTLCIAWILYSSNAFGSEAGMPQLNPEFWTAQIFWLIITFLSLYIIIWKIFLPKITYSIENRKSKIVSDLDEAQKIKENAEKKLKEYLQIIDKAKKEANTIIDNSKKKLDKDIQAKKQKFDDEIEKELANTEKEIKNLKSNAISSICNIASEASAEIVKQLINTEVNMSNVSAVVNDIAKKEMVKNS